MIAIIRDGRLLGLPNPFKPQCPGVCFYDFRNGYNKIEHRNWELIVVEGCVMQLDWDWIKCIETHSKKWITI